MNEYTIFTLRMIQDDPSFFYWINEPLAETLFEYVLHLQMNEAQRLYGGN